MRRALSLPDLAAPPLRVALLAFDDAQVLDITGPLEVFGRTSRWLKEHRGATGDRYVLELLGTSGSWVRSSSGLRLAADRVVPARGRGPSIDTLLIAGGRGASPWSRTPSSSAMATSTPRRG